LYTLRSTIGNDVFINGLVAYVFDDQFGNADDEELWSHITQAARAKKIIGWDGRLLDVQKFMDPYMKQVSFPILNVKTKNNVAQITQASYYDPKTLPKSDWNYTWNLPIFTNSQQMKWLVDDGTVSVDNIDTLVVNPGRKTYTRVLYDDVSWSKVKGNYPKANETWRAGIITDTYAFVK
jgi:aminopeptidase N